MESNTEVTIRFDLKFRMFTQHYWYGMTTGRSNYREVSNVSVLLLLYFDADQWRVIWPVKTAAINNSSVLEPHLNLE